MATTKNELGVKKVVDTLNSVQGDFRMASSQLHVDEKALRRYMKANDIPENVHDIIVSAAASIALDVSHNIDAMLAKSVPDTLLEQLQLANVHAGADDLVSDMVDLYTALASQGIHIRVSKNPTSIRNAREFTRRLKLHRLASDMFRRMAIEGNVALYVRGFDRDIKNIKVMSATNVETFPLFTFDKNGEPKYKSYIKLSRNFINFVKKAKAEELRDIPDNWIEAANSSQTKRKPDGTVLPAGQWVELDPDNERLILINSDPNHDRLAPPRMKAIFPDIANRKLKKEGEFSVDFHIKHLIHQITITKNKPGGGVNPYVVQKASQAELDDVHTKYKNNMGKSLFEVTTDEVDHKFHGPDFIKVSPPDRYLHVEDNIMRHFGFSRTIAFGDGGNYSAGYIMVKGTDSRIKHDRAMVGEVLAGLYAEKTGDRDASVGYDNAVLKESKQLLDETKFLAKDGYIGPYEVLEIYGYDAEQVKARRKEAMGEKDLWTPVFESSQGIVAEALWGVGGNSPDGDSPNGEPGAPGGTGPSGKDGQPDEPRPR